MGGRTSDLGALAAMALLVAALFAKGLPFALEPARVANPPGAFDTARALARLERILTPERPHPVDSDANDAVRARLLAEIEALGYAPEVRDDFICSPRWRRVSCARVRNVVFRAGPAGGGAILIASHYDSVPAGPGAADDGLGVAAALEIAALIAGETLPRSVIFLFTDGEEAGLLGAKSFVETDPWADDVARVVNLEARGVRGPALMFETAHPNESDVRAYAAGAARPFSNSLMTDIYRLMPNDTDVSEFLAKGYGAINFALTGGVAFYHTPRDELAALDPASVQHMGDSALGAFRIALADAAPARGTVIFSDVLSRWFLVMPQWLGGVLLALGGAAAAVTFVRAGEGSALRAILAPPLILAGAGGLAFGLQALIDVARGDALYWSAEPRAMQALSYLCAALAVAATLALAARGAARARLEASSWLWFALIGLAAFAVAPGASILFAPPLAIYAAGVMAGRALPILTRVGAALAFFAALVFIAPSIDGLESVFGFAVAWAVALSAGVLAMLLAPLALRDEVRVTLWPVFAFTAMLAMALGAAMVAPAHSPESPRPLNIQYFVDADAREARWLLATTKGSAPAPLQALAPFAREDIEGLGRDRLTARAPFLEPARPELMVMADTRREGARRVRVHLAVYGANEATIIIPEEAGALSLVAGGRRLDLPAEGAQSVHCTGRACDGAEFEFDLSAETPAEWTVIAYRYGLPFAAAAFVSARPEDTTQVQRGDVMIVRTRKKI